MKRPGLRHPSGAPKLPALVPAGPGVVTRASMVKWVSQLLQKMEKVRGARDDVSKEGSHGTVEIASLEQKSSLAKRR